MSNFCSWTSRVSCAAARGRGTPVRPGVERDVGQAELPHQFHQRARPADHADVMAPFTEGPGGFDGVELASADLHRVRVDQDFHASLLTDDRQNRAPGGWQTGGPDSGGVAGRRHQTPDRWRAGTIWHELIQGVRVNHASCRFPLMRAPAPLHAQLACSARSPVAAASTSARRSQVCWAAKARADAARAAFASAAVALPALARPVFGRAALARAAFARPSFAVAPPWPRRPARWQGGAPRRRTRSRRWPARSAG